MALVKIFASLNAETNLPALWEEIKNIPNIHLGGRDSRYTIEYTGGQSSGMLLAYRISQEKDFDIQITSISPLDLAE